MEPDLQNLKVVFSHMRIVHDHPPFLHHKKGKPPEIHMIVKNKGKWTTMINPRGGRTTCTILDVDGNVLSIGVANCSMADAYNKTIGRAIAYGRALKNLNKENKS